MARLDSPWQGSMSCETETRTVRQRHWSVENRNNQKGNNSVISLMRLTGLPPPWQLAGQNPHQHSGQESGKQSQHLSRLRWGHSLFLSVPQSTRQSMSQPHFNLFYHQMYLGLWGVLKGRGVLNPYGTRLDGWWVSYGLVRQTHFLHIYLKSTLNWTGRRKAVKGREMRFISDIRWSKSVLATSRYVSSNIHH